MPCPSIGPKCFWSIQIVLDRYKPFWTGPICFGWVLINLNRSKLDFIDIFGSVQNDLYL